MSCDACCKRSLAPQSKSEFEPPSGARAIKGLDRSSLLTESLRGIDWAKDDASSLTQRCLAGLTRCMQSSTERVPRVYGCTLPFLEGPTAVPCPWRQRFNDLTEQEGTDHPSKASGAEDLATKRIQPAAKDKGADMSCCPTLLLLQSSTSHRSCNTQSVTTQCCEVHAQSCT